MDSLELNILKLQDAADKMRTLAHPLRIAIVKLLETEKMLNVTDIYTRLQIDQATASHHLNMLKNKGLLLSRRTGKSVFYSLKNESITQILRCLEQCDRKP